MMGLTPGLLVHALFFFALMNLLVVLTITFVMFVACPDLAGKLENIVVTLRH